MGASPPDPNYCNSLHSFWILQLEDVWKWRITELVTFDFTLYPDHFRKLLKNAFKPVILNRIFHKYGFILVEDAGQEFRQPITKLKEWIKTLHFAFL